MANVVNRATLEVQLSVHTPDFDPAVWLINPPGLKALLANVPRSQWIIVGNTLRQKTAAEITAGDIDPTALAAAKATRKLQLAHDALDFLGSRYSEEHQRFIAQVGHALASIVPLRPYLTWVRSIGQAAVAAQAAVDLAVTIPAVNAINLNTAPLVASDPGLTLSAVLAML